MLVLLTVAEDVDASVRSNMKEHFESMEPKYQKMSSFAAVSARVVEGGAPFLVVAEGKLPAHPRNKPAAAHPP